MTTKPSKLSCERLIILCGGLGSRLLPVVNDRPKVLAEVQGKPFLSHLLSYFENQNITEVILSTGVGAGLVSDFVEGHAQDFSFNLICCPEDTPLGTGGAIAHVARCFGSKNSYVINGDSFWPFPFSDFSENISKHDHGLHLLALPAPEEKRFGNFAVNKEGLVQGFIAHDDENKNNISLWDYWVNGGMYYATENVMEKISAIKGNFSLESDFFPEIEKEKLLHAVCIEGSHIDIGTVASYSQAQKLALFRK